MPFVPHTERDIDMMLYTIGAKKVEDLFDEIPQSIKSKSHLNLADGLNECQMHRLFNDKCAKNIPQTNFIGAGAYQHYTPAIVTDVISRGEFYTSYTPYQAEASQGTLQVIYEYQTMIASLTGMDISNASMYDGATALAESVLMAVRANKKIKSKKVLITDAIFPQYVDVIKSMTHAQGIELEFLTPNPNVGKTEIDDLPEIEVGDYAAVIVPQVNFYGQITEFDAITDWAHESSVMVIGLVNPMTLGLLKAPGYWGEEEDGADIACGDGQSLGLPLSGGGPYFGFITTKEELSRQMPGRIVGRTVDVDGKEAFCLTLQAREQHIRRAKATSNICSNQGLLVTAATVYMTLMGAVGLKEVALQSHQNTHRLIEKLAKIPGVKVRFTHNYMYEMVVDLPISAKEAKALATKEQVQLGYDLGQFDAQQANSLLVCVTEVHNETDLNRYVDVLTKVLATCAAEV
ncbi:aminomethyl-transferring glycine dehydrogenase subunit GcvPA [Cysteiniphilum sp. JM-1]|uniref:aminomethyl-transferring glycine dehydrogenase subunit GcvPA n=1 Tax=Cysteiniphilum sp. JM-1 TaxID=2610891 RepID=UPI001243CE1A|nr:aminomethyl-transferring glycine dehydrogenase subunit GcvPA [Cysteiniphilum sp. JM-1]